MEANISIKEMKEINSKILKYLGSEENCDSEFQALVKLIKDFNIEQNKYKLSEFILILSQIYQYRYRSISKAFRAKAEQILLFLKDSLQQTFSSEELYYLVRKSNIIDFFYTNKMINITREITIDLININMEGDVIDYFQKKSSKENSTDDQNEEKVDKSELILSKIIEKDLIDEFISFTEKNKIDLSALIDDTDIMRIIKSNPIEYASSCNSIKILNYLLSKDVELSPKMWEDAISFNNLDLVKKLHDKKIECPTVVYEEEEWTEGTYDALFIRAIQSHKNEIAKYLQKNFLNEINTDNDLLSYIFKYHNYEFIPDDLSMIDRQKLLTYACNFGYSFIIDQILNEIDVALCQDLLFLAINGKNIDIVRILLNKPGIDVNYSKTEIEDFGGHYENKRTPLCRAVDSGVCEIVKLLLSNPKIDVNKPILIFIFFYEKDYSRFVLNTIRFMEFQHILLIAF